MSVFSLHLNVDVPLETHSPYYGRYVDEAQDNFLIDSLGTVDFVSFFRDGKVLTLERL